MCTLEGILIFHMTGVKTYFTPLSLTIAYRDCIEYLPGDSNCQIIASMSP
jgi:hypothetical protein